MPGIDEGSVPMDCSHEPDTDEASGGQRQQARTYCQRTLLALPETTVGGPLARIPRELATEAKLP